MRRRWTATDWAASIPQLPVLVERLLPCPSWLDEPCLVRVWDSHTAWVVVLDPVAPDRGLPSDPCWPALVDWVRCLLGDERPVVWVEHWRQRAIAAFLQGREGVAEFMEVVPDHTLPPRRETLRRRELLALLTTSGISSRRPRC